MSTSTRLRRVTILLATGRAKLWCDDGDWDGDESHKWLLCPCDHNGDLLISSNYPISLDATDIPILERAGLGFRRNVPGSNTQFDVANIQFPEPQELFTRNSDGTFTLIQPTLN